jgi:pseudomonalisin
MTKRLRTAFPAVLICVVLISPNLQAEHPLTQQYRSRSVLKGRVDPNYQIRSMMFAFKLQNQPELERLLQDQQDPASVNFHRWLMPAEFGARFGVSTAEYQNVVEWLGQSGFTVRTQLDNRLRIYFDGAAQDVERAFGVKMGWYELQGKAYYSSDMSPQIPASIQNKSHGIYGLDSFPKVHPLYKIGGYNALAPKDLQTAYNLASLLSNGIDGTGQSIAVVEISDFNISDAQTFRKSFGLPPNDPLKFFVGANPGIDSSGGGEEEALLDMEWAAAVAPGAAIQVVIAPNSDIQSAMDYIVNQLPATRVISISFGDGETDLPTSLASQYLQSLDFYFMQAAAQGQTFLVASGDEGAQQTIGTSSLSRGRDINYLCSSGYVVCVGGTTLNLQFDGSGNATQYLGETVWNTLSSGGGGASGGGASRYIAKPSYQAGPGVPADGARDVPDVAAVADPGGPGALIVMNGTIGNQTYGGTSLSTPIWAGLFALINQFGSPGGVGWANPRLYQLGTAQQQSPSAPSVFYDVAKGNNATPSVTGFSAGAGFDLVTGWGSFNGDVMIRNFSLQASPPASVSIDGSLSASGTIPSGNPAQYQCTLNPTQYTLDVPAGALQLAVTANGPSGGDVDLYIRKGQPVGDTGFSNPYVADYNSAGSMAYEAIYISPNSTNPLTPGTYYVAVSNCTSAPAVFTLSANLITPSTSIKIEELSVDNGIVEDNFNNGDVVNYPPLGLGGTIVVNRLRPTLYPSTLTTIRIYSDKWDAQNDPTGQQIRIIAFSDAAGTGIPPANPVLLVNQVVTIPGTNGFMDYTITNPPVIQSGDWYVGFQHPSTYHGVIAALNKSGVWQQAGFVSINGGASFSGPYQQVNAYPPPSLLNANFLICAVVQSDAQASARIDQGVSAFGATSISTSGGSSQSQVGYATVSALSGSAPFGTAVFSYSQNGVVVSEVGVPASPPTTHGRIFIDYRTAATSSGNSSDGGVSTNTGLGLVNRGSSTANIVFTLWDVSGSSVLATGHTTLSKNAHVALFVDQLNSLAPDFNVPASFPTQTGFGTLDILSDQAVSILALRLTANQRGDPLLTSTPVADMTQSLSSSVLYFPQLADGGGYTTMMVLMNTNPSPTGIETGRLSFFQDDGTPQVLRQASGASRSTFSYSIPVGGVFIFQSDGSPSTAHTGSVQVVPDVGTMTPVGAGIFGFTPGAILVTQSGTPSATPTTHARIYVDMSGGHDTGLALANPGGTPVSVRVSAFQLDGITPAGTSSSLIQLAGNGHIAAFADQFITGLPNGFTGLLDISAPSPFVALTLRALVNARNDFLLTTFPIADYTQAVIGPLVFPQVAKGGGYQTQIILLNPSSVPSTVSINYLGNDGSPLQLSGGN